MPLTQEQEDAEHDMRMEQMAVNIDKMRADMRAETWKIVISAMLAAAALLGAGVGIGNLIWAHQSPPAQQRAG